MSIHCTFKKITDETMYWTYQRTMDISIFSTYHVKQTIIASPTQMLFYKLLMNWDIIILLCRFIHFRTINKTFSISIITSAEVLNNSSNFLQSWNVDNNMLLPQCMQYVLLYLISVLKLKIPIILSQPLLHLS